MPEVATTRLTIRRVWTIAGQVQGVGFRPFIYRLAKRFGLVGRVWNDAHGVVIDAQGFAENVERFTAALVEQPPALVSYRRIATRDLPPIENPDDDFAIAGSRRSLRADAAVTIDSAVCDDCLLEMADPSDRRHRYGLINCTNCGPRYTIIRAVPYDRPNTSMAHFSLCRPCRNEYEDACDRRFHAQPVACQDCGPRVQLIDPTGGRIPGDPYSNARYLLGEGKIVAVKGIGGFHLAVRADDETAVARLRRLKHRDAKPFALMAGSMKEAESLIDIGAAGRRLLPSPGRPILLANRRAGAAVAEAVAPHSHRLGVMLPYTPIQHLLLDEALANDNCSLGPLVMTSANRSDEPLVIDNDEALARVGELCDAFIMHDRPIARAVDDSVFLDMPGGDPLPLRRARGFVPQALALLIDCDTSGLCVGGELKNTVAVVRPGEAILSQHLGDLKHPLAFGHFTKAIEDLCDLFGVTPNWIAHDRHPAYLSSVHANNLAKRFGAKLVPIQHHHAHAASLLAEHGETGPMLTWVADGVGYGDDGSSWGGELLLADLTSYRRLASLAPLQLPGGDAAATDTRRCALAMLRQAFGDDFANHCEVHRLFPDRQERNLLATMLQRSFNCATSSAVGRLFDGVAALLDVCSENRYEAEAPQRLEALASAVPLGEEPMNDHRLFAIDVAPMAGGLLRIDFAPFTRTLLAMRASGVGRELLAAMFHDQLSKAFDLVLASRFNETDTQTVGLTGGVFCNQRLTESLTRRLQQRGLRVLRHAIVPPNDGGIALGQAAIASARCASVTMGRFGETQDAFRS